MVATDQRFRKSDRLLKRSDFDRVFQQGARASGQLITLVVAENDLGRPRIGFVVSRKYGNAIKRNRFKRVLREVFRLNKEELGSWDLALLPKNSQDTVKYKVMEKELLNVFSFACQKAQKRAEKKLESEQSRENSSQS